MMKNAMFCLVLGCVVLASNHLSAQCCETGFVQNQFVKARGTVRHVASHARGVVNKTVCNVKCKTEQVKSRFKRNTCCAPACQTSCQTTAITTTTTTCCERPAVIPSVVKWALAPARATMRMVRPCANGNCSSTVTETVILTGITTSSSGSSETAPSTSVTEPTPAEPTEVKN